MTVLTTLSNHGTDHRLNEKAKLYHIIRNEFNSFTENPVTLMGHYVSLEPLSIAPHIETLKEKTMHAIPGRVLDGFFIEMHYMHYITRVLVRDIRLRFIISSIYFAKLQVPFSSHVNTMPTNAWTRPKRGSEKAENHGFMDTFSPPTALADLVAAKSAVALESVLARARARASSQTKLLQGAPELSSTKTSKKSQYSIKSPQSSGDFGEWAQGGKYHSEMSSRRDYEYSPR